MEEIGYQVVHAITGRTRIRIPGLETQAQAAGKLQRLIESLNFVTSVRINPLAQSIVILYKASSVSQAEAEAQFVQAIQQFSPKPPPSPPSPTEAPATSVPGAPPSPLIVDTFLTSTAPAPASPAGSLVVADAPVADSIPSPPLPKPSAEEIPCPWDDPIEPQNEMLSPHSTDPATSTEVQEPEKPQAPGEDSTVLAQAKQDGDQKKTASKRKTVRKPTQRPLRKPL